MPTIDRLGLLMNQVLLWVRYEVFKLQTRIMRVNKQSQHHWYLNLEYVLALPHMMGVGIRSVYRIPYSV